MKYLHLFLLLLVFTSAQAQPYAPNWASLDQRPTPNWFQDAKFGIFIHWGLYSVPAWATTSNADGFGSGYSEWYWQRLFATNLKIHPEFLEFHRKNYGTASYQDFVQHFKAELFKPEDWAKMFADAGAKYVVLTSKHHEGFALWPSAQSWNWNAVDVGPHRDLAGDLSKAVKARNLHMGFYYSLYEWFNPVYKSDVNRYVNERMLPQMKDLVTRYEPDILWTDGEWDHPAKTWQSEFFLAWLFNESKVKEQVVVNDRWGNDTKGKHGEAIYGTRKWEKAPPYNKETQVYFTRKGQNLYAIQRKWSEILNIKDVAKPKAVRLLGYAGEVKFSYKNNVLQITAPQLNPNTIPCAYAWTYVIEG